MEPIDDVRRWAAVRKEMEARNIDALSTSHRIYAVDLAGFGGSRRSGRFRLNAAVTMLTEWLETHVCVPWQ